ncbi:UDP-N-acetylmuramate dehydrogenase [Glaciimonas sp. Gout2]|uniref:UDP-N-acetylmuramate dehydrogenase n=1 Tax=unclassified Glaciimonas TaxID=2644401 RepID=UPI002B232062|nr:MULTISPECIES: UDP-N-acetylmuramate dehydrogenase [unclassified Glaciimonas]MEB0013559.1 UDP-N-acetylmuramate dehydrogenase [Glaciimonas sp. Cout2]MEB0083240.1 UDP-N-acetylmuramate dehydrogenase [Glaciimonas sp. Gout2]
MPFAYQHDTTLTANLAVQTDFPMRALNTLGIEATAHAYLSINSVADLQLVRSDPALSQLPRLILGGGSNVVLTRDFPGLVLHIRNQGIQVVGEDADAVMIRVAAGETWHALVEWTLTHGLGGLENLSLIPGNVGAAPIQNIGAYGIEMQDRFHALTAFDFTTGEMLTLHRKDCAFGYRDSIFKHALRDRAVVIDVTFSLPKRWQADVRYGDIKDELAARGIAEPDALDVSNAVIAIRTRKLPDPAVIGNAGSFFKNPIIPAAQRDALLAQHPAMVSYKQTDGGFKLAAGWLIDQCGWKGKALGRVAMYQKQALVLVNLGGANGQDVVRLSEAVQADVMAHFGVALEPEPIFV